MNCREVEEREILEAYLLNRLDESERDQFEKHYFECDDCLSRLHVGLALQEELRSQPAACARAGGSFLQRVWLLTPTLAMAVLLVAVGIWLHSAGRQLALPATDLSQHLPKQQSAHPPLAPSLDELARVEPPPYNQAALRGAEDEAEEIFRNAMQRYAKGDYAGAIPGLRVALKSSPQSPRSNFYLGACYLLTDKTTMAVAYFRRVITLGETPYAEPAHFYLAKAYLKSGQVPDAKAELQKTVQLGGNRKSDAEEILQQLPR